MSLQRACLVAIATILSAATSSGAFACCDWVGGAPVAYVSSGCGGCGTAVTYDVTPIAPAPIAVGCCGAAVAPLAYVAPVAPVPVVAGCGVGCGGGWSGWGGCGWSGCGGWGGGTWGSWGGCGGGCGAAAYVAPVAPAPIYVVNQGPAYTGPGISVPYRNWSAVSAYPPARAYPYVPYRRHVAYRGPMYGHPPYMGPRWRPGMGPWRRPPMGVRG